MGLLNKAKLLEKQKLEIERVDLGDDEFVYVTQMTGRARDRFERSLMRETKDMKGKVTGYEQNLEDFRAKLAAATVCDENGTLLLEPKDAVLLSSNMSAARLEKIIIAAQKLNAITEEDKEALVKNSEAAPDGSSNSGSVSDLE
jgi:hypothetical protein